MKKKYDHTTFQTLFYNWISYSAEEPYPPRIRTHQGLEYVDFYKLTLCETGVGSYKMEQFTFSPHLWPKIKKQAELLIPDPVEKVLYE